MGERGFFAGWREDVRRHLAAQKAAGARSFDAAWAAAMAAHPPRGMERQAVLESTLQLTFDDPAELSVVEFMREACRDAWMGRARVLEDLPAALEGGLARDWPTVGGRHLQRS